MASTWMPGPRVYECHIALQDDQFSSLNLLVFQCCGVIGVNHAEIQVCKQHDANRNRAPECRKHISFGCGWAKLICVLCAHSAAADFLSVWPRRAFEP